MAAKRILVVDDDPMVRESIELMLELDGHAIDLSGSGPEALQRYETAAYDVVLTDNRMAGMTGLQLAREIKARNPAQPIILFSGSPSIPATTNCDLVLMKPFSAGDLRQAVLRLAEKPPPPASNTPTGDKP
jgi:CheY-like chemotaxis protein